MFGIEYGLVILAYMKTNKYVTFEQSKLLKELGFNEPCFHHYKKNGNFIENEVYIDGVCWSYAGEFCYDSNEFDYSYSAPTLHEASDWLICKGLYTYPVVNALRMWFTKVLDLNTLDDLLFDGEMFDTYEEALSHGIDYCLSVLKYRKTNK